MRSRLDIRARPKVAHGGGGKVVPRRHRGHRMAGVRNRKILSKDCERSRNQQQKNDADKLEQTEGQERHCNDRGGPEKKPHRQISL
jgi:hypothetical protein